MLEGIGLVKVYRDGMTEVRALNGVDISINKGEFIALVGPSGSGKTTLIHILGLIEKPTEGSVIIDGERISDVRDPWQYRARKVTIVFQFFNLLPRLTALENVALPLFIKGTSSVEAYRRAAEALIQVGLQEKTAQRPDRLSGGEQQRVAIARALASGADYILADEPTGNLDTKNAQKIVQLLQELSRQDRGVMIATHNLELASRADKIYMLRDGRIIR